MDTAKYAITKTTGLSFEEADQKVRELLKSEGFGVLTEIDVQATLKKKLDEDFRRYVILGACNPTFAHKSLSSELSIGLLLPCNVIIYETNDGQTQIETINPRVAFSIVDNEELVPIAEQVYEKLNNVINNI